MSGAIMVRRENGIILLSDGGLYHSQENYTLTGFVSKPIILPHLSTVMAALGSSTVQMLLEHGAQIEWDGFDDAVTNFRLQVKEAVKGTWWLEPERPRLDSYVFLGGYSESRRRWETYSLLIAMARHDDEQGVGDIEPAAEVMTFPFPDADALRRYGFTPPDVQINNHDDDLVRLMRAQRATPQEMGDGTSGYILAGFIEKVSLYRDFALSEIVWRWPDRRGEMVNPDNEGEPVHGVTENVNTAETS